MKYKKIKGFERYSINNKGDVINNITGNKISQRLSGNGYRRFNVRRGDTKYEKPTTLYTHRVVAEHYIPNSMELPEVNHKNGNKEDNRTENLEWVSCPSLVYCLISLRKLRETHNTPEMKEFKRVQNKATGITKDIRQYTREGQLVSQYDNAHVAARSLFPDNYKYKDRLISRCARGQAKTAYGYKWEYV